MIRWGPSEDARLKQVFKALDSGSQRPFSWCSGGQGSLLVSPPYGALVSVINIPHPSGFACARLQSGLTSRRAYGAELCGLKQFLCPVFLLNQMFGYTRSNRLTASRNLPVLQRVCNV